jgi:hypothetical protein
MRPHEEQRSDKITHHPWQKRLGCGFHGHEVTVAPRFEAHERSPRVGWPISPA